jgi:hypothetical protein
MSIDCFKSLVVDLCFYAKTLLAVTWRIFLLFSVDHAFAEHFSLSFSKFCPLNLEKMMANEKANMRTKNELVWH